MGDSSLEILSSYLAIWFFTSYDSSNIAVNNGIFIRKRDLSDFEKWEISIIFKHTVSII
jgi:hypothetical protein